MRAIALAIIAAAIGFIAKLGHDVRSEHQARKALAASLSGELGAYLRLLQPEKTMERIRSLVEIEYERRKAILPGLFSLPMGHPVFDRVADKIGTLSPEAARGISEAYNIITSGRLMLASLSSEAFIALPNDMQVTRITVMTDAFAHEIEGTRRTVALLDALSCQSFVCYLFPGK